MLTIVALVCLAAGFGIGQLVRSPQAIAEETAVPPDGLVTAKVEARAITSAVVARADVAFADPVEINPLAPEDAGAPVVTGQVPEVGTEVTAGSVILEVSGRPVFVLPGSFRSYRSLGPGSSGPDVLQLRAALAGLGLNAGDGESKTYDAVLADAVKALYDNAGYPAPGSEDPESGRVVRDARDAVQDAKDARDQAARDLVAAKKLVEEAPDAVAKTQAGQGVDAATQALAVAERSVTRAGETLADAEKAAWTQMPVGDVVFVADLPRRVDQVNVQVGEDLTDVVAGGGEGVDPAMGTGTPSAAVVLSGADIQVTALVNADEAALLQVDGPAVLTVETAEVVGKITEICPEAAESQDPSGEGSTAGQCLVKITVTDLGAISPESMVGNVLATMVVGTSSEDSLVVPLAAVSADTAGSARVEIIDGNLAKDAPAADQPTRTVGIVAGLTAEGMVEVKESEVPLKAGDLVVIGRGGVAASPSADSELS
ncbi:MAG: hypothetical protein LBG11_01195 [Bifidobacteriaceae bacterium]|nr:hypothetical protein [Bifidobacteriaceae bacterium]